jgi:hypothetical protein
MNQEDQEMIAGLQREVELLQARCAELSASLTVVEMERDAARATCAELVTDGNAVTLAQTVTRLTNERDAAIARAEKAEACAEERRVALIPFQCETCSGTHLFTYECQPCLTGIGSCICSTQKPEPCPQCQSDNGLKEMYAALEHALSSTCGTGYISVKELDDTIELLNFIMPFVDMSRVSISHIGMELSRLQSLKAKGTHES